MQQNLTHELIEETAETISSCASVSTTSVVPSEAARSSRAGAGVSETIEATRSAGARARSGVSEAGESALLEPSTTSRRSSAAERSIGAEAGARTAEGAGAGAAF